MIVYAVAAEVSILKMFVAGVLPGIMLMLLFSGYIVVWALLNPERTPEHVDNLSFAERVRRARNLIPCIALIVFVMGAMFTGYATATEAASFGVLGALVIAGWSGSLTRANLWASLMGATRLSCMILFILARRGVSQLVHGLHRRAARARRMGGVAQREPVRAHRACSR